MKNKIIPYSLFIFGAIIYSCEYDNYDPPKSFLKGSVMYNNTPVGVRSGGTRLELWQKGYELYSKIDVYIDQNGTFSASLFDGEYQLVRLGGAPWENNTDSINIQIRGNTEINVPVIPYFTILDESYQKSEDEIISSCMISRIGSRNIESLTLYIGTTSIVDANNNVQSETLSATELIDLNVPKNITLTLNSQMKEKQYIFARIGVKTIGVGERFYTPVNKIELH